MSWIDHPQGAPMPVAADVVVEVECVSRHFEGAPFRKAGEYLNSMGGNQWEGTCHPEARIVRYMVVS